MAKKQKQDEFEKQIGVLKEQIQAIQEGVCKLKSVGMRESVLYMLISRAAGVNTRGKPIPIGVIRRVMEGIDGLHDYVFPE